MHEALDTTLHTRRKDLAYLRTQAVSLTSDLAADTKSKAQLEVSLGEAQRKIKSKDLEIARLGNKVAERDADIEGLTKDIVGVKKERKEYEEAWREAAKARDELDDKVRDLKARNKTANEELGKLQAGIDDRRIALEDPVKSSMTATVAEITIRLSSGWAFRILFAATIVS